MAPSIPYAVILGTAQDGGFPHVGCACRACRRAQEDPKRARRVACLGLVTSTGVALVDATPQIGAQLHQLAQIAGRSVEEPPRAILLTHLHAGHVLGLALLGREGWAFTRTPIWATEACVRFLEEHEPFAALFREGHLRARRLALGWDASLDELMIQPVPVPHRNECGDTVGYRIEGPQRSLFYAPDLDAILPEVISHVRGADVAVLDGTFFRTNELARPHAGQVHHPPIAETMEAVASSGTCILFTHLNHTNPALDPRSRETQALGALGMRIAREGEVIELA